jgi:hypothetical protein
MEEGGLTLLRILGYTGWWVVGYPLFYWAFVVEVSMGGRGLGEGWEWGAIRCCCGFLREGMFWHGFCFFMNLVVNHFFGIFARPRQPLREPLAMRNYSGLKSRRIP